MLLHFVHLSSCVYVSDPADFHSILHVVLTELSADCWNNAPGLSACESTKTDYVFKVTDGEAK